MKEFKNFYNLFQLFAIKIENCELKTVSNNCCMFMD